MMELRSLVPMARCGLLLLLVPACSHIVPLRHAGRVRHPVDQAASAWRQLATGQLSAMEERRELASYHVAVEQLVLDLSKESPRKWAPLKKVPGATHDWTLRIDTGSTRSHAIWQPGLLDSLEPSDDTHEPEATGLLRKGLGTTLLGVRKAQRSDPDSKFLPPKGQFLPVTAVLEFDQHMEPTLRLYDPREAGPVSIGRRKFTLAADFCTPTHHALHERGFLSIALAGLVRPERFLNRSGLFMLEPYRKDKVPVLFVHGLLSDPHIWEPQAAALMADPDLGSRVQCWYFVYPTGMPVAASASGLRSALKNLEARQDPDHNDPGMKQILVIGHSMGGLLTRMQVIDSGEEFWKTWFTCPPEKLPLKRSVRDSLEEALYFKHNPNIKRVIFIATPHRGSDMVDGWLGRLGSSLIRLPGQTLQMAAAIVTLDLELVNPQRRGLKSLGVDSLGTLSPKHPLMQALAVRPIHAKYHSIIGRLIKKADRTVTTDGAVPYWSSQLPGAESEVIVPHWHCCVEKPETVTEVRRIARLHVLGK